MQKKCFASLAAVCALMPFTVAAQGGYAGLGIGYGSYDNEDFFTANNELHDDRSTWQINAGMRLSPWFGFEGSYVDFGEADGDGGFLDANGFGAAAALHMPVHDVTTLSVRVGHLWWDASGTAVAPINDFHFDEDGSDPFYGVGIHVGNEQGLGAGLRYDWYELDETDIEVASINLIYGF